jgi:hypothetical protein
MGALKIVDTERDVADTNHESSACRLLVGLDNSRTTRFSAWI